MDAVHGAVTHGASLALQCTGNALSRDVVHGAVMQRERGGEGESEGRREREGEGEGERDSVVSQPVIAPLCPAWLITSSSARQPS